MEEKCILETYRAMKADKAGIIEEGASASPNDKKEFIAHLIKAYKIASTWESDDVKGGSWANETLGSFIEKAKKQI